MILAGLFIAAAPPARSFAQTSVTVDATRQRGIGGVTQLDRNRFFNRAGTLLPPNNTNLGDIGDLVFAENGLNVQAGRETSEFDQLILQDLDEDPNRPGFADPNQVRDRIRGSYRNFVENGSRYRGIRQAGSEAFLINGGRYTVADGVFLPEYILQPGTGIPRVESYVEFLNIYLEEAVFGPDAFHPVDPERFYIELINEPDLHFSSNFTRQDYVDFHREVAAGVRAVHPEANIGGPSLAITLFETNEFQNNGPNDFSRFEQRLGNLIAGAGQELDFYSIHPYERYDVQADGTVVRALDHSPGRVDGLLDLIRARDLAVNGDSREDGQPLQIALTEYGSFNLPNSLAGNDGFGSYTRDEQQWDLARDVREQLLVYLDRPDAVLSATPFIGAVDFRSDVPTNALADNVLFETVGLDGQGNPIYQETILAQTFRAYANVSGSYIGIEEASNDLQTVAFRDGNEVYVLVNNLVGVEQTIDLNVLAGLGTIESASIDRLFRQNGVNTFIDDQDITGGLGSLVLNPDEGSVITITLAGAEDFALQTNDQTFYSRETVIPVSSATGTTESFTIDADVDEGALAATLRISYSREDQQPGESFRFLINNTLIDVPGEISGLDDGDFGLQTREIDIPIEALIDGENELVVDFVGPGGFIASTALIVTSDINFLAGVAGDFNDDGLVSAADYVVLRDSVGAPAGTLLNDPTGGPVGAAQFNLFNQAFGDGVNGATATALAVPEPTGGVSLLLLAGMLTTVGRLRR